MKNTLTSSFQDDTGTWWYRQPTGIRQRAKIKVCITCTEQFLTYPAKSSDYCSLECYRKTCKTCGCTFHAKTVRQTYCSEVCKRGRASCTGCQQNFIPSKKSLGKFCSRKCYYNFQCPVGTVRNAGNGYKIVKVPDGTPGSKHHYGPGGRLWMLEHRWVMQQILGRVLGKYENVHHINGQRDDNRPENLELWNQSQPSGIRAKDYHCVGCKCFKLPSK